MAAEQAPVLPMGVFVPASTSSEWYKHLDRWGSCLRLLDLLEKKRELIHELGPEGTTVLHKGVAHGCVKLVKFILVNMFDDEGRCTCGVHGADSPCLMRDGLLRKTNEYGSTAVNIAVVSGSPKMVLLLKWAINKDRELEQQNWWQNGDDADWDDRSIRIRSTKEKGCEVEGDDLQCLPEVVVEQERIPSETSTPRPPDVVEEVTDSVNGAENKAVNIPEVIKDDAIDGLYESNPQQRARIQKVYSVLEVVVDEMAMDSYKDMCKKHVDFEFVPVAHVFLHFLSLKSYGHNFIKVITEVMTRIVKKFGLGSNEGDGEEGGIGTMMVALFNILDPRGRTILHAALGQPNYSLMLKSTIEAMRKCLNREDWKQVAKECLNAKDGAGRTILHLLCIRRCSVDFGELFDMLDWDVSMAPLCPKELATLQQWCFESFSGAMRGCPYLKPIHLAIVFNSEDLMAHYLASKQDYHSVNKPYRGEVLYTKVDAKISAPIQIAAFLGRATILEELLKHHSNFNSISDKGLGARKIPQDYDFPAIHCAALAAQVKAIQVILKYPMYDPMVQTDEDGTALHILSQRRGFRSDLEMIHTLALLHSLPNSLSYQHVKNDFIELQHDDNHSGMFSSNEITCINLLLQAGIDVWTPHIKTKEHPSPGPTANDEARRWWYDKVLNEVVTVKTSISSAANATSVVAALVATASFIGPLQPPLSYTGDGGYIHTSLCAVRIYVVCNSLSFYFSMASILMAILPAIPMPKESTYDELFRSQRCLKAATLMLLISIICILIGFSSAMTAVVSPERRDEQLVGASIGIGGLVCLLVLVIYTIRLLRMLFHKNDRFRRWFARYMYF